MQRKLRNRWVAGMAGLALVAGGAPAMGVTGTAAAPAAIDAIAPMAEGDVVAYTSPTHTFTMDDVIGNSLGETDADNVMVIKDGDDGETFSTYSEENLIAKDDGVLYPINSTFGFDVKDFVGATEKDFDDIAEEGWVGEFTDDVGSGLQFSDAETDVFKSGNLIGSWAAGLGGNEIKASTEHFTVMEGVLSCYQTVPYEYWASRDDYDKGLPSVPAQADKDLCEQLALPNPVTDQEVAVNLAQLEANEDDISVLEPPNLYLGTDYAVTEKDDGKVLYRWGQAIKKPNDIRFTTSLALPEEWKTDDAAALNGGKGFRVTRAELYLRHAITNNPNDQIRPEDWENEGATGLLPEYTVKAVDGGEQWLSTKDCFEGDGSFIPAGTLLRDSSLGNGTGAPSSDLAGGYGNAWYTTIDRDPFEWMYRTESGGLVGSPVADDTLGTLVSGPRWRMKSNKFGQDLPSMEIPAITCDEPPYEKGTVKYEVGVITTTTLNLLDWSTDPAKDRWADDDARSPFAWSAGWMTTWSGGDTVAGQIVTDEDAGRCASGSVAEGTCVTSLGTALTEDFDVAFYVKGDKKPLKVYDVSIYLEYEGGTPPPTATQDFGDAPATYGTALVSRTVGDSFLGASVDPEPAPQTPMDGTGDDVSGTDDEDGVELPAIFPVGESVDVGVSATGDGVLDAMFDWNADGDFDDDGELVADADTPGALMVDVPEDAATGPSFARFVLTTVDGEDLVGEVEDHPIVIGGYDYGDLPDRYDDKVFPSDPARHLISSLSMKTVDAEAGPQGDSDATGDDLAGIDDEDGVNLSKFVIGKTSTIRVSATEAGYLRGWIDWNADGEFTEDELVIDSNTKDGTRAFKVPVPEGIDAGTTFGRFRVSTTDAEMTPFGTVADGEVEDHLISISGSNN